jgi:hypothetical protein
LLRIIAICAVISTIILTAGALVLVNDRFDPIGTLREWNSVRLARKERHDYFTYQYNKAVELVGGAKADFIKRACASSNPNDEVWMMNSCITSIAQAMAKKCSDGFSAMYMPDHDVRTEYEREKAAGTISFACD